LRTTSQIANSFAIGWNRKASKGCTPRIWNKAAAFEINQPHAVLLDVQLGREDGLSLARWIRQRQGLRPIPVIACAAYSLATVAHTEACACSVPTETYPLSTYGSNVRLLSEKAIRTGTKRSKAKGRSPLVLSYFVVGVCTACRPNCASNHRIGSSSLSGRATSFFSFHLRTTASRLTRRSSLRMVTLPLPVQSESLSMPGDDRLGLHDEQCRSPATPESCEPYP
jgi:CheY-like chemotaxis protein